MSEPDKQLPASAVALRPLEDVTRGLLAVIEWRGNFARAGRESGINPETLKTWAREMYPEQMQRLEREYAEEIERELVMEARGDRPLLMIDLAVPRDIEPGCREVTGVSVHDVARPTANVSVRGVGSLGVLATRRHPSADNS